MVPKQDPVPLAAVLGTATRSLGLVITLSTMAYKPFMLARLISTLDHMTRGRFGWNIVTTAEHASALNLGLTELPPRQLRYDIVNMDEAVRRLAGEGRRSGRRFAVLTFDDGLRDHLDHALPVLERHGAPGTFYVTTGFADRTARLWWIELEEAIRRADRVSLTVDGEHIDHDTRDPAAKRLAFDRIYWRLREGPEADLRTAVDTLCCDHTVDPAALVERYCLDWPGIEALARHPLVTVGAHTLSHPMLAKHAEGTARREIGEGRAVLERRLGRAVQHLAYPVGDPASAGAREFRLACEAGYASAVTTRPGLLFPAHDRHPHALPRVSMNGNYQTSRALDVLLSGMALLLWNKGRRVLPA